MRLTYERDAAADDHNDDEHLEPAVINQLIDETAQRPPLLTGASPHRRFPPRVLAAPAGRTTVLRVLDWNHRHLRHFVYTAKQRSILVVPVKQSVGCELVCFRAKIFDRNDLSRRYMATGKLIHVDYF